MLPVEFGEARKDFRFKLQIMSWLIIRPHMYLENELKLPVPSLKSDSRKVISILRVTLKKSIPLLKKKRDGKFFETSIGIFTQELSIHEI